MNPLVDSRPMMAQLVGQAPVQADLSGDVEFRAAASGATNVRAAGMLLAALLVLVAFRFAGFRFNVGMGR